MIGTIWKHVKTEGYYRVVGYAVTQDPLPDLLMCTWLMRQEDDFEAESILVQDESTIEPGNRLFQYQVMIQNSTRHASGPVLWVIYASMEKPHLMFFARPHDEFNDPKRFKRIQE